MDIFKLIGALGLIFISAGIVNTSRKTQDILYILGGICFEIYSVHLADPLFIILQGVFTGAAVFDLVKSSKKK